MSLDLLTRLGQQLDEGRPTYDRLAGYYLGTAPLAFMAPEVAANLAGRLRPVVVNWCRLVVGAVEERLDVEGFRPSADQPADLDLWRLWQANSLDEASQLAHLDALVYGRSYAVVWAGTDPATPRITVESSRQMTVRRDPMTGEITSALKRWSETGHAHAVVYERDRITRWRSDVPDVEGSATFDYPVGGWTQVQTLPNPLGVVPVVALVNRPRLLSPDGESELTDVLPLADAVSKVATDMLVTSEYFAAPRRWITGMDLGPGADAADRTATEVAQRWTDAPASKLWVAADPTSKFGQFPEANLDNFATALATLTGQVAALSSIPPHYFGLHADQPASADAIRSSEASLVAKARRRQRAFGGAWEDVMRLAVLVRDGVQRPGLESLETVWRDPETRTVAQAADRAGKLAAIGVPLDQLLEDLGYTPLQIERMRDQRPAPTATT